MLAIAHISVTSSCDVEITLHLVQVQASVDTTAVSTALDLGRLCPLGLLPAERNNVVNVLLTETLLLVTQVVPARLSNDPALAVPSKLVHALAVNPLRPEGLVAMETLRSHDSIARCVLHVYVNIIALHSHHNVEVDLQLTTNTRLDLKVVRLGAAPPPGDLTPDEDQGDDGYGDCPFSAARGSLDILRFRLGCFNVSAGKGAEARDDVRNASKALTMLPAFAPKASSSRTGFSTPFIMLTKIPSPASFHAYTTDLKKEVVGS